MINGIRLLYVEHTNGLTPIRAKEMKDWHWIDVEPEKSLNVWEVLTLERQEEGGSLYWCDSLGFRHESKKPVGIPPTDAEVKELLSAFGEHCRQLCLYEVLAFNNEGDYMNQGLPSEIALTFSTHLRK